MAKSAAEIEATVAAQVAATVAPPRRTEAAAKRNPFLIAADLVDPPQRGVLAYRDNPSGFVTDCIIWPEGRSPTPYQLATLDVLVKERRVAVRGPHGLGKDLTVETPIPTPSGWTTMGALRAGDVILDEQGAPCTVTYAEVPQLREAYRIRFSDGATVDAGAGHLWSAVDVYNRPRQRVAGRPRTVPVADWRDHWDAAKTRETREIGATLRTRGGQLRWRVPTARSLRLPDADLPIDPYVFGYWLGDGTSTSARFTVGDGDREHLTTELRNAGYAIHGERRDPRSGAWTIGFALPGGGYKRGVTAKLRALGVLGDKGIPDVYLRASAAQRRALVQGLWDSDGYRQGGGCDEIALTSEKLARDVAELLRTLGLSVRVSESDSTIDGRVVGRRWRIAARFDFRPYRLDRYEWSPRARQASRHTQRTITAVEPLGRRLTRCIAVDSPRRLFLAGRDFIPTHNTAENAWVILWFALTRDAEGADWKIPTTASAWRQLEKFLWPEVHKWSRLLDWEKIGREPFGRFELLQLSLKLRTGEAFAVACDNPATIEGVHADQVLYIYDEAKTIPPETFDASEGAFSGAGGDTAQEAFALASSTPGPPMGRFYEIHSRRPGFEDWHARRVTLEDTIDAGRVSREWAEQRKKQWGEDSAVYRNRVLGEFASSEEDGVIPLAWVEAANERWEAFNDDPGPLKSVGADIARSGSDKTVLALRHGWAITELRHKSRQGTMESAGQILGVLRGTDAVAVVDVIGIGAGVVDRLREQGQLVLAFNASEGTKMLDRTGELGFVNCRAAAWWSLRELLDPDGGVEIALPPDDNLIGDLTSPRWRVMSGGRIQVEAKDDIKKRLGRSTDDGDAVVQAFWSDRAQVEPSAPLFTTAPSRHRVG